MIIMRRMTPEKKEKFTMKLDKMIDFIEEFKECLEDSEDYDGDDMEDEPMYSGGSMNRRSSTPMKGRYSRRGGM